MLNKTNLFITKIPKTYKLHINLMLAEQVLILVDLERPLHPRLLPASAFHLALLRLGFFSSLWVGCGVLLGGFP